MESQWKHKIFTVNNQDFEPLALEIFQFQYSNNHVYHEFINALHINVSAVQSIMQIPFLPIRFFKSHAIQSTSFTPEVIFESSGTTSSINSRHFIKDISLYEESFITAFEFAYGAVKDWCIIGLLPSYLERGNSSLACMVNSLIQQSNHPESGFYLYDYDKLLVTIRKLEETKQKTILIGVTFALLDLAEKYSPGSYGEPLEHTIIMETGGMKGRRKKMIRQEVHDILKKAFNVPVIHSEYGMTELLSQAYSKNDGIFHCPPWMKILIRDEEDPLAVGSSESGVQSREFGVGSQETQRGVLNIIDLANIYSCSFIATDDAGKLFNDGSFEVLGRIDNSDLRGCSLMVI